MIKHDQIPTLKVESVQLVACLFGVHDILVHHERRSCGVVRNALADLPYGAEFAEEAEELVGCYCVGEILDEEGAVGEG